MWCACTAATPVASTAVTATPGRACMSRVAPVAEAGVAPLAARRNGAPSSSTAPRRRVVGAEGEQLGRPGQGVDDLGREGAGERGHLVVAAAAPGEQRGHGQRDQEREAEGQGGPRQNEADGHGADGGRPGGDGDRQQRAEVEVLQGIDVVDGAGEQVAAAPAGQCGGDPGGEAVVEPHAASGSARAGRRRDRRAVRRSAGGPGGRRAPRPRPGCRRGRTGRAASAARPTT